MLNTITQDKTNQERLKNTNDFIAYPALFFRTVTTATPALRKKKKKKKIIQQPDSVTESENLSVSQIKQFLPVLSTFEQDELEEWADGVSKLILKYNIMKSKP